MNKDKLIFVTNPAVLEELERNDFASPVPAHIWGEGAWVYVWSMEQRAVGEAIAAFRQQGLPSTDTAGAK